MFVSEEEFDEYKREEMLAYTKWGNVRYCCLVEDVFDDAMSYVIDEFGLQYLREHFSDAFHIFAVRIHAPNDLRKQHASEERMLRDEGLFTMDDDSFDYIIKNNYISEQTQHSVDKMVLRAMQQFT